MIKDNPRDRKAMEGKGEKEKEARKKGKGRDRKKFYRRTSEKLRNCPSGYKYITG